MSAEQQPGIGVSAGISIGRALVLETHEVSIYRLPILPRDVDKTRLAGATQPLASQIEEMTPNSRS